MSWHVLPRRGRCEVIAARLVRLIETHSDELASSLLDKWLHSESLADLRKVPPQELRQRVFEVYRHLGDWLLTRTDEDVEQRYAELGARRAGQGVPMSAIILGLDMVKHHLWDFVRREALIGDELELHQELELLQCVDHFFDRAIYHAARGYEKHVAWRAAIASETVPVGVG